MAVVRLIACGLVVAWALYAGGSGRDLASKAKKAEKAGDAVTAYLYYSQAAALEPGNRDYWARSQALRTQALLDSEYLPASVKTGVEAESLSASPLEAVITPQDLEEARRLEPPPRLAGDPGTKDFDQNGDGKQLFEHVAAAFGLRAVFDGEYEPGQSKRLAIRGAGYAEGLRVLCALTGSFIVPISDQLFLVAKDTPQKRQELEPTVAVVVPIPDPVSPQETTELAQAVQQSMEIQRLLVDTGRRMVLIRDRMGKVLPAQRLFEQLLQRPPEVVVEVEFLEVTETSSLRYGMNLPTSFPLVWLGKYANFTSDIPKNLAYATFGGGLTLFGIGISNAELFASMTRSSSRLLLRSMVRSLNRQPATLHVGDKYPIMTVGYFGPTEGGGEVYTPPPTFNFEDLGVSIKVTPYIHGDNDVTLEVEAEFKVLAGESLNGIPVIANRKFQGMVRLRDDEWAIVAGLVSSDEVKAFTGLAGVAQLPLIGPLLRENNREKRSAEALLVLKPRIVARPPSGDGLEPLWTGSEARPRLPI